MHFKSCFSLAAASVYNPGHWATVCHHIPPGDKGEGAGQHKYQLCGGGVPGVHHRAVHRKAKQDGMEMLAEGTPVLPGVWRDKCNMNFNLCKIQFVAACQCGNFIT